MLEKDTFVTYLQHTNYDCGAGAAGLVLLNFGASKVDHDWLMSVLEVRRDGTRPEKLEEFFKKRRKFDVFSKEESTIPELRKEVADGKLCIVLYQGSGTRAEISNMQSGHYSVVAGVGKKYVYLLDPGVDEDYGDGIGWTRLTIETFKRRWKDRWWEKGKYKYSMKWMLSIGLKII